MDNVIIGILGLAVGVGIGFSLRILYSKKKLDSAENLAKKIIADAHRESETKKREGLLEVKEVLERERRDFEKENKERRIELQNFERRLNQKEENLERKVDILERKERELRSLESNLISREKTLKIMEQEIAQKREEQKKILENIAGMSSEEAKKILMQQMEEEARQDSIKTLKIIEQETRETAERKAKEIIAMSIQRCAADHTTAVTVTNIPIPNDELKGRVIGREGRNIRAFEQATGVDLIVDDTPETITISAFDPVRREIARLAMEQLLLDGRIHPTRIEEIVNKVKQNFENSLQEIGEKSSIEAGVMGLNPEILKLLGKLKIRTSFGQNQLQHTLEVVWLSEALASELRADISFCKRAALLHDIGKAVDHDVEGTHHQLSADIAKKYGESEKMQNAILSHHEGICAPQSVEAFIICAADAISASRPGARKESVDQYIKRLERLEKVASSFPGITNTYAIQAGREVRILVDPEKLDDNSSFILAKNVAKKIQQELEYPGQIKVTVIRELRAQEIAK